MNKKHFEAIARNLRERVVHGATEAERHVAAQIAREQAILFGQFNDRFDQRRFLDACGVV